MARDPRAQARAEKARDVLREELGIQSSVPRIGIVLGTGWGSALNWNRERVMPFSEIEGFAEMRPLEGHARKVVYGSIEGQDVIALQGRVHLNEAPPFDSSIPLMVRLQIEMFLQLGVRTLILTAAAGSLKPEIEVGDMLVVDGFVSLFAPEMPMYAGEFHSPDDVLDPALQELASDVIQDVNGRVHRGGYAMVRGPYFEGRKYDKPLLAASGASTVGMSSLPEACIASLYPGVRVLGLNFITNTASEEHSHEENQRRAKEKSGSMARVLHGIVRRIGG